jgi:NAD(P)-dependent dehydrogenase (short-subunit alcohol dehydrogenase family)
MIIWKKIAVCNLQFAILSTITDHIDHRLLCIGVSRCHFTTLLCLRFSANILITSNDRDKTMLSTNSLSQLKCLVTGASSGIGRATCQVLSQYGAQVVGTGRNEAALQELKESGGVQSYIVADVTQEGECSRIVTAAVEHLGGGLTTLVNAAGVLQGGAMGSVTMENYHFNMTCNTQAPFELMVYAIPYLKQQPKEVFPSIVNVSSVNGLQAFACCAAYCMSKAALDQLTRCASVDLAPFGIRVNSVNPGVIATNLQTTGGLSPEQYASFIERSISTTHPLAASLGRIGKPEEVAELIAFLVSDKAVFMTGECIAIDGGRQNLGAR